MSRPILKILKSLLVLFAALVAGLGIFLGFMTITEYDPPSKEILPVEGSGALTSPGPSLTFMTWNIGYSGLGKNMDFFYEGGKRVRPEKEEFESYFAGIRKLVNDNDSIDFIFLQEVDKNSKRSYRQDEISLLAGIKNHYWAFAKNYDCRFVPLPVDAPMGKVQSGILTLARYKPEKATRFSFSSSFSWPQRIFFLKRCFMVLTFHLENGKSLIVINTHNSTFDKKGELRKVELEELRKFATGEFMKGNYVIAGGDWNNNPPGFQVKTFSDGNLLKTVEPPIRPVLLHGWNFVYDPSVPTNRDVDMPYEKGKTKTTIIDFFVISPNVDLVSVKTLENGFANSDHQPVIMKVRLKP